MLQKAARRHASISNLESTCVHPTDPRTGFQQRLSVLFLPRRHARTHGYNQLMRYLLIHWLLSGVALLVVARIIPGIQVEGISAALIAALVIGLVSATVGLILKIVLLPFIILTLGILYFLINGLMLKLASQFVPGFRVDGCLPAVLGSILLTIVNYFLNRLVGF
jgi:putative membrane protein